MRLTSPLLKPPSILSDYTLAGKFAPPILDS